MKDVCACGTIGEPDGPGTFDNGAHCFECRKFYCFACRDKAAAAVNAISAERPHDPAWCPACNAAQDRVEGHDTSWASALVGAVKALVA